ncbi:MAG: response regulator [Defluviitaleaceae bacterium]|nr:response regulator [Defluviitaleaceae bacterium]MCL2835516.1 response regulator [Defluviitaleaceae bacterium]
MQGLVFIVDDNDANLTVAASALENDYRVLTMPSAQKMFALLNKKKPDIILLDVEMPEMSGLEAIVELKRNPEWSGIPVFFVTGWIDDGLINKAMELGAVNVISKPFVPSALLECIKNSVKV